jgi:hypothetical protein
MQKHLLKKTIYVNKPCLSVFCLYHLVLELQDAVLNVHFLIV